MTFVPAKTTVNIDEYAFWTEDMWFSQDSDQNPYRSLAIMAIGLGGEAGEVQEHIKKEIRDGKIDLDALKKELGDVIYYWARICRHYGFQPMDVIQTNVNKLLDRLDRGTLRGDGDNR
jgi:NTP pyrophosphatase (non-canonical NTP hydrolase)